MTRVATQVRLEQALTRLLAGQPTVTDGELTVSNLCREAGVGRDSFYRTPPPCGNWRRRSGSTPTRSRSSPCATRSWRTRSDIWRTTIPT